MQKTAWLIVGLIVIVGGWYLWTQRGAQTPAQTSGSPAKEAVNADTGAQAGTAAPATPDTTSMNAAVSYDGKSFSPSSITIKKGGTVTFTSTAGGMWVASAPHPAHTGYDGTSAGQHCSAGYAGPAPFDQCAAGTSFTFTFDKVGTWNYHNHLNASAYGSVTVE